MHFSCADFFKEFIKMIYMDLRWSGINSMTLLDNAKYMVEEHVKSKNMETYMCDTCFIAKILQRIQKYEIDPILLSLISMILVYIKKYMVVE